MDPRWNEEWASQGRNGSRDRCRYLGGTNDFDLWIDGTHDVRVAWGPGNDCWDWFCYNQCEEHYAWGCRDVKDVNHKRVLEEALTYIRIFAPWVEEEMKTGKEYWHKGAPEHEP